MSGNLKQATGQIQAQVRSLLIVSTILSSLSLQFFFFWKSRFMKIIRHQKLLGSCDTRPFTRQGGIQKRLIVWPTAVRKLIRIFNISKQLSILCLCVFVSAVQIKYRILCKFRILEYSVYSIFYNIPCILPFHRIGGSLTVSRNGVIFLPTLKNK